MQKKIDELCRYLGKTRTRIAKEIGISGNLMSLIYNDNYTPKHDVVGMICDKHQIDRKFFETDLHIEECITPVDPLEKEVGKRVKEARLQLGLRQLDLAIKSGIAKSIISRIERGDNISYETYSKRLAKALDVGEEWLLTGSERNREYPVNEEMVEWLKDHPEKRMIIRGWMENPEG